MGRRDAILRWLLLRALRWTIISRYYLQQCLFIILANPRRSKFVGTLTTCITILWFARHYLIQVVPRYVTSAGQYIFKIAQDHPAFGRFVHVVINAVPDTAYALLAVAGLAYLVPEHIKKLEEKPVVRVCLIFFFAFFGLSAIVINAVNRESQEFKDTQNGDRIGLVLKDVSGIQTALNPANAHMTEAERRAHLLTALKDEYELLPGPVDPDILAGKKAPPADWLNARLRQMGETFAVKEEPSQPFQIVPHIVQTIVPEPKKAHVVFSFYREDFHQENPQTVFLDPMQAQTAKFALTAIVSGDVTAEDLHIWIRRCKYCTWGSVPAGFIATDPDHDFDRELSVPKMEPNIGMGKWEFTIKVPSFAHYQYLQIAAYYACENCDPVDWKKGQKLYITDNPRILGQLQFAPPQVVDTAEPTH